MTKTIVLPGLLALGFALCLTAQSEADYPGWMKDIGATKGKITKGIAAKQNADVAADATHLASVYKQLGTFWAGQPVTPRPSQRPAKLRQPTSLPLPRLVTMRRCSLRCKPSTVPAAVATRHTARGRRVISKSSKRCCFDVSSGSDRSSRMAHQSDPFIAQVAPIRSRVERQPVRRLRNVRLVACLAVGVNNRDLEVLCVDVEDREALEGVYRQGLRTRLDGPVLLAGRGGNQKVDATFGLEILNQVFMAGNVKSCASLEHRKE